MASLLLSFRYIIFSLFMICNAIICSVAVWNFTLARDTRFNPQIDVFLIFVGALGVVFILPVIFIDLFRKNALFGRVWFECVWVAIFWMLELAGAAALTATLPSMLCSARARVFDADLCSSTNVLLAFTWMCAVFLLIYLVVLIVSAIIHQDDDSSVWQSSVRFFPWFATRSSLGSAPPSPTRAWQKPLKLAAPQPKWPVKETAFSNMDPEVGKISKVSRIPAPVIPVEPPRMQQNLREAVTLTGPSAAAPSSLYPAYVQARLPQSPPSHSQAASSGQRLPLPPLGDWPRTHQQQHRQQLPVYTAPAPSQAPIVSSRRPAPPAALSVSAAAPLSRQPQQFSPATSERSRRGSGGSLNGRRPAPLNLSGISAYQAIDARRNR